jgi:hypothetical protein
MVENSEIEWNKHVGFIVRKGYIASYEGSRRYSLHSMGRANISLVSIPVLPSSLMKLNHNKYQPLSPSYQYSGQL